MKIYLTMEPMLLFSLINTDIRDNDKTLDEIAKENGIPLEKIMEKMENGGYIFNKELNKFQKN